MKTNDKSKRGRNARRGGKVFENDVRHDLESQGWTVTKWGNNIVDGKIVAAKSKWNPFLKRVMSEGSGFPDFLCFRPYNCEICKVHGYYSSCGFELSFVEAKKAKYLDAEEKKKIMWIKEHLNINTFVAFKGKGKIEYVRCES